MEDSMNSISRRQFVRTSVAASLLSPVISNVSFSAPKSDPLIWGNLLHLSFNMWEDRVALNREMRYFRPFLRFDEKLWNELLKKMAAAGMNMVVLDVGDGVLFKSHPEIAVENAWSIKKLKDELKKCRSLGLEPIPKLNFSSCHDAWMGEYSRQLSTKKYYDVCRDLIHETAELFDSPRYFHLGMDEETYQHQRDYAYVVVRQHDLWWDDFLFLAEQVESTGSKAWIWSDYMWHHKEEFLERMPKNIVQSNWYYRETLDPNEDRVKAYLDLDKHGYEQVPTASNHSNTTNFGETAKFAKQHLDTERLLGFLQTPWRPTINKYKQHHLEAIQQVGDAIKKY
jgi:hypothetical protein